MPGKVQASLMQPIISMRMAQTILMQMMQRQTMMDRIIRQHTTTIAVLFSLEAACHCDHLSGVRIT
jgi:hypothetical protein